MAESILDCRFYRNDKGREPVREWLLGLDPQVRKTIGTDIRLVQWRWPVAMPLVRSFGNRLYELRSTLGGNSYRVFFCIHQTAVVLLHGFMKKTQRTPDRELRIARKRQNEVEGEP